MTVADDGSGSELGERRRRVSNWDCRRHEQNSLEILLELEVLRSVFCVCACIRPLNGELTNESRRRPLEIRQKNIFLSLQKSNWRTSDDHHPHHGHHPRHGLEQQGSRWGNQRLRNGWGNPKKERSICRWQIKVLKLKHRQKNYWSSWWWWVFDLPSISEVLILLVLFLISLLGWSRIQFPDFSQSHTFGVSCSRDEERNLSSLSRYHQGSCVLQELKKQNTINRISDGSTCQK